jgi:hypothetical protein
MARSVIAAFVAAAGVFVAAAGVFVAAAGFAPFSSCDLLNDRTEESVGADAGRW